MATLEELLRLNGVVGAFEFTPDGRLLQCEIRPDVPPEVAVCSATFCAALTALFNTEPAPVSVRGEPELSPEDRLGFGGLDYLVVTGHNRGVFAEGKQAIVEELIEAVTR